MAAWSFDHRTAREAYNRWRGFSPGPAPTQSFAASASSCIACILSEQPIPHSRPVSSDSLATFCLQAQPKEHLALDEVQMEGKARMSGTQFAKDFQLHRGERLA